MHCTCPASGPKQDILDRHAVVDSYESVSLADMKSTSDWQLISQLPLRLMSDAPICVIGSRACQKVPMIESGPKSPLV